VEHGALTIADHLHQFHLSPIHDSLEATETSRGVQFIDGSGFRGMSLNHFATDDNSDQFNIEKSFLVAHIRRRLIRSFSTSRYIDIMSRLEMLGLSHLPKSTGHPRQV
jgi:hypothetical protein